MLKEEEEEDTLDYCIIYLTKNKLINCVLLFELGSEFTRNIFSQCSFSYTAGNIEYDQSSEKL